MKYCLFSPRQFCLALTVGVGLLFSSPLRGDGRAGHYLVFHWTSDGGLPQNTVRSLLQTSEGCLWIGTRAGVARFDGVQFQVFNRINTPELANDNCVQLAETRDGALWIGTEDGLVSFKDYRFTRYAAGEGALCNGNIRYLCPSPRGGLWIATSNGLDYFDHGKFSHFSTSNGLWSNNIRSVFEDSHGRVWASSDVGPMLGGLQRMSLGSGKFVGFPESRPSFGGMTHCLAEDAGGTFWWGNNVGLHRLVGDQVENFGLADGVFGDEVKWIANTKGKGLILVTGRRAETKGRRGIELFRNGRGVALDPLAAGVEDDLICAAEDSEGNIWTGSRHDGLVKFQPTYLTTFTKAQGLPDDNVTAVYEYPNNGIVFGMKRGLATIKDGVFVAASLSFIPAPVRGIATEPSGYVWVACTSATLIRLPRGPHDVGAAIYWPDEIHPRAPNALYFDRNGSLWAGDDEGVVYGRDPPSLHRCQRLLPDYKIEAIIQDRSGGIWFASSNRGLVRRSGGQFKTFTTQDGLPSNEILSLYEDMAGHLWIGTEAGLCAFRNGQFHPVRSEEGVAAERINCIVDDKTGFLWLGTLHGIYRVNLAELSELISGKINFVHRTLIGEKDGMPSSEVSGDFHSTVCRDSKGHLWFCTVKGLVEIDPETFKESPPPPPAQIQQVRCDGKIIFGFGAPEDGHAPSRQIHPGVAHTLEIKWTASAFTAPEQIRFRYRLGGYEEDWHESDERRFLYENVPPGRYSFEVKASNRQGYWHALPASFPVDVPPMFSQTKWYPICWTVVVGVLGALLFRWRMGWQRRALFAEQNLTLERERARIARDMHDDLGASVTKIRLLSEIAQKEIAQPGELREHIQRISRTSVEVAQAMDEVVWAVNPRNDTLEQLADYLGQFAEEQAKLSGIRFRLEIPPVLPERHLPADFRHSLFLIVKEALNNVVKHSNATEASVRIRFDSGILAIVIEDNGRGFDFEPDSSSGNGNRNGNGMENLRQRAQKLGGILTIDSRRGAGVSVRLELRLDDTRPRP